MASPPTAIVPLPVVIAERPISLTMERLTTPVVRDSRVASTIERSVLVTIEVSIPIDRYVVAVTKLIRVTKTIHVLVPCPVRRNVSFTIERCVIASTSLGVPVAICGNVTPLASCSRCP
jgi:hypothetical protein